MILITCVYILQGNKAAASYKTKVIKNWDHISAIYSKDHATGEGAKTGVEAREGIAEPNEVSPELPQKRQRTGEAILCMLGDMRTTFQEALKSTDPIPLPKVTPPSQILDALKLIPNMAHHDLLRAYAKLTVNERLVEALMDLPVEFRKDWLSMLP
jgi:hypothetical protein